MAYSPNKARVHLPSPKIKAWIERHFPDYRTRREGQEYLICNPFNGDSNFKMNINPDKMVVHDWRGDDWAKINPQTGKRKCSFIDFVMLYKSFSFDQAVRDILQTTGPIAPMLQPASREPEQVFQIELPKGANKIADELDHPEVKILLHWLKGRGYTVEEIAENELYHAGVECIWPYFEFEEIVYWQSRNRLDKIYRFPPTKIKDKDGKIIGKSEYGKGDFLYGFDDCLDSKYAIITESIFGKHTLGEHTLATGGAAITPSQIKKLSILAPESVILSPDNDRAGIKSVLTNGRDLLRAGFKVYYSLPPATPHGDGHIKDWNEMFETLKMSKKEIRSTHDKSIRAFDERGKDDLFRRLYSS